MAPNPVAVLQSYVEGRLPFEDRRVRELVEIGWLSMQGELTDKGRRYYEHGWDAGRMG